MEIELSDGGLITIDESGYIRRVDIHGNLEESYYPVIDKEWEEKRDEWFPNFVMPEEVQA